MPEVRSKLQQCFHYFDQVETVGDKYMAVSGLPTKCSLHAQNIAFLALDMMDITAKLNAQGQNLQVLLFIIIIIIITLIIDNIITSLLELADNKIGYLITGYCR